MWTRRAEASSRFSFNLRSSLDLPLFPFSSVPPLLVFCPLPRPFFQHPITASACCLSCGVHGWKWLGTSNHWRGEKGREVKETERERLTSIFGRKNANIINEHNEGWWPLNVPSDFFANVHTCDAYSPSRTCVPHWGLNSKLYRRVTASAMWCVLGSLSLGLHLMLKDTGAVVRAFSQVCSKVEWSFSHFLIHFFLNLYILTPKHTQQLYRMSHY